MANKKKVFCIFIILFLIVTLFFCLFKKDNSNVSSIDGTVLEVSNEYVKVLDKNGTIYTLIDDLKVSLEVGENISVKYDGKLDKTKEKQEVKVISYTSITDNNSLITFDDNGIFSEFYEMAYAKLKTLSLDEKIGQIFLVRVPDENKITDLKKYKFGGYLLYEKDFSGKTKKEVIEMIDEFQSNSKIPLLITTDEEGGKVVRLSNNKNLVSEPFKSSSQLYEEGGLDAIKEDTIKKTDVLEELGINVNLAPVVDVSTDPNSYMYERTLKQNTIITSSYAKTVVQASKGSKVSYTLKHFPGYGNNADTHVSATTDNRTYASLFEDDIPPFKSGIKAGAEAILVSHNTVPALDKDNPASLSASVHNVLRNELGFTGVIMTDDLDMNAITDSKKIVKAILAGNDLLIVTDYESAINDVKKAINDGTLTENLIDKLAFKILSWKYYKLIMYDSQK